MTLSVAVADAALMDITAAANSYDLLAPGLGDFFAVHVETVIDHLGHYPEMYQVVFPPVRRAVLHRFPFAVFYHLRPQAVEVIAVLPCRADPELLFKRADSILNQ